MNHRCFAESSPRRVAAWLVLFATSLWFVSLGCGAREVVDRGAGGAAAPGSLEARGPSAGTARSERTRPARRVIAEIGTQFRRRLAPAAGVRRTSPDAAEKAPFFGAPWKASFEPDGDGALRALAEDEAPAAIEGMAPWRQAPPGRLGSRFPAGADGEVEVTVAASGVEGPGVWVRERLAGASITARGAVVDGRVVYAAAKPGLDRVYEVTAQRVEEYVRIADAGAAEGLTYEVETGPGIADLVVDGSGYGLVATDASGKAVLKAPQPVGVDARGEGVQARLVVARTSEQRFVVNVALVTDVAQVSFPVLLDPGWVSTGSMADARDLHTATLLQSGKVLVAAGNGNGFPLNSGELYDPMAGTWSATGSMATGPTDHTATLLPSGKVLVAGGNEGGAALSSAELYDPAAGTWSFTGSMVTARFWHTATLLQNGKVLVAGGYFNGNILTSAELYDPTVGTWSDTGSMANPRESHTATLLPSGKVVVAAGESAGSAELYDPMVATWSATGSMTTARGLHTATLLKDGKVLVAAGSNAITGYLSSAELYDPVGGSWSTTGSMANARAWHTATLLPDSDVLVAGGAGTGILSSAELYDPTAGTWSSAASMANARYGHTATLLQSGQILVAAGYSGSVVLSSAELYGCTPLTSCPSPNDCGTIFNCGGTLDCGTCTLPQTCSGGGMANVCGCTPITCPSSDNCGMLPDGCGGTLDCGNCNGNGTCSASLTCTCSAGFMGATCNACAANYDGYPNCTISTTSSSSSTTGSSSAASSSGAASSSSSSSTSASSGGGAGGASATTSSSGSGGAGGHPATTSSAGTTSSSGGAPEILPGCACVPGSRAEQRGAPGGLAWSALALAFTSRRRRRSRGHGDEVSLASGGE